MHTTAAWLQCLHVNCKKKSLSRFCDSVIITTLKLYTNMKLKKKKSFYLHLHFLQLHHDESLTITTMLCLKWAQYFSFGAAMKWINKSGPIHELNTTGQLQEIKGPGIKGGDNSVHCCTHPHKKKSMLSLRGQVVWWRNTWLGRGPNLLNTHLPICLCPETTQQRAFCSRTTLHDARDFKVKTGELVSAADAGVCEWIRVG